MACDFDSTGMVSTPDSTAPCRTPKQTIVSPAGVARGSLPGQVPWCSGPHMSRWSRWLARRRPAGSGPCSACWPGAQGLTSDGLLSPPQDRTVHAGHTSSDEMCNLYLMLYSHLPFFMWCLDRFPAAEVRCQPAVPPPPPLRRGAQRGCKEGLRGGRQRRTTRHLSAADNCHCKPVDAQKPSLRKQPSRCLCVRRRCPAPHRPRRPPPGLSSSVQRPGPLLSAWNSLHLLAGVWPRRPAQARPAAAGDDPVAAPRRGAPRR